MKCVEMHCSGNKIEHEYGSKVCDWVWDAEHEILYGKNEAPTNREDFNARPTPADRWDRWMMRNEKEGFEGDTFTTGDKDWARRGDGALMLQDQWGWFAMVTDATGTIYAESADMQDRLHDINSGRFEVYCEPVWLAWAADAEAERENA